MWRLSAGRQARHALASGVWQGGIHQYKIRDEGVAWKAPDGSAVFLPWSALTGVRETGRLFLLLDQDGSHVRGFVPKTGAGDRPAGPRARGPDPGADRGRGALGSGPGQLIPARTSGAASWVPGRGN